MTTTQKASMFARSIDQKVIGQAAASKANIEGTLAELIKQQVVTTYTGSDKELKYVVPMECVDIGDVVEEVDRCGRKVYARHFDLDATTASDIGEDDLLDIVVAVRDFIAKQGDKLSNKRTAALLKVGVNLDQRKDTLDCFKPSKERLAQAEAEYNSLKMAAFSALATKVPEVQAGMLPAMATNTFPQYMDTMLTTHKAMPNKPIVSGTGYTNPFDDTSIARPAAKPVK